MHQATRGVHVASFKHGVRVWGSKHHRVLPFSRFRRSKALRRSCNVHPTVTVHMQTAGAKRGAEPQWISTKELQAKRTRLCLATLQGIPLDTFGSSRMEQAPLQYIAIQCALSLNGNSAFRCATAAWTVATSCRTRSPIHSCRRSKACPFSSTEAQRIRSGGSNTLCILQATDPCLHF